MSNTEQTDRDLQYAAQACQDASVHFRKAAASSTPHEKREHATAALQRLDAGTAPVRKQMEGK